MRSHFSIKIIGRSLSLTNYANNISEILTNSTQIIEYFYFSQIICNNNVAKNPYLLLLVSFFVLRTFK